MRHYYVTSRSCGNSDLIRYASMDEKKFCEQTIKVLDTMDYTEEYVNGVDLLKFWKSNQDLFINLPKMKYDGMCYNTEYGTDLHSFDFKDGTATMLDNKNIFDIKHKIGRYTVIRFLPLREVVFISKTSKGYSAKVLHDVVATDFNSEISKAIDGLDVLTFSNSKIHIRNDGVSFEVFEKYSDLSSALERNFNYMVNHTWYQQKVYTVCTLAELSDFYPLDKGIVLKYLKVGLSRLTTELWGTLTKAEQDYIMKLVNNFCDKQAKAQMAKKLFLER